METYYATPDPSLLLSSDGILVARAPGLDALEPTREELPDVLAAAFGRAMDAIDHKALGYMSAPVPLPLLSNDHDLYEKTRRVFEKAPGFHEFTEFFFAIGDLMGWTHPHDPLLEQVKAMDSLLHGYFKHVDKQIFADWSSTRKAMLADVQALASSARDTIRSIVLNNEDLQAPFTVSQLALASRDSQVALNTFTGAVDSGYWLRPYSGPAVGLDTWGTKLDDRAPVNDDGTVWDPRIAMPTLLYALVVRLIVLKALHSNARKYCHEIKDRVAFLLKVQMHWQTGICRKLHLSAPELKIGAGFSVRPFAAGAVDVFTGNQDLIDVDFWAANLSHARGFWVGRCHRASLPSRPNSSPRISHATTSTCDSRPSTTPSSQSRPQSRSHGCAGRRGYTPSPTRSRASERSASRARERRWSPSIEIRCRSCASRAAASSQPVRWTRPRIERSWRGR